MKKILIALVVVAAIWGVVYNMYPQASIKEGVMIDSIVVEKAERKMSVYSKGVLQKTYSIALGKNPVGHKQQEGDGKTPEGLYHIYDKTTKSRFHKNLGVDYPNASDRARAKSAGHVPGGNIKIHGLQFGFIGRWHTMRDWTAGCIAVTNTEIDELYKHVPIGVPVMILP